MTVVLRKVESVCHVCKKDAYEKIFEHGLRTADQLLRDYGYSDADRVPHVRKPRPQSIELPPTGPYGAARIAHNQPLLVPAWQEKLRLSLEVSNCTLGDYCELLNTRVYFWAKLEFADGHVTGDANGYTYEVAQDGEFDVIRVRLATLTKLATNQGKRLELTELNSGSAPRSVARRGPDTWTALEDYAPTRPVQEVTVVGGIHGLAADADVIRFGPAGSKLIWVSGRSR